MTDPVVRAETYYLPPPPPRGDPHAWDTMPAAERVFAWVAYRMNRRVPLPAGFVDGGPLVYARINQNRWIGDCPTCGSVAVVSPTDPRYGCTQCKGGWWVQVFPADPDSVEAEMLLTPEDYLRNWWNPLDPANPYTPAPDPVPQEPQP